MGIDRETCWYKDYCCKRMNDYFDNYVKNNSEEPFHIQILKEQLNFIPKNETINLLDIGCGTASSSIYCNEFMYEGCDFEHIINSCAKRNFSQYKYHIVDIENSDMSFIAGYNVLLLNAIIDVMERPLVILHKILTFASNYVVVHRQEISKTEQTKIVKNESYGGYTYHSIINENDFNSLIKKHGFVIVNRIYCDFHWENGGDSLLLKKI